MEIFSLYLKLKKNWIGIVDYAENRKMFKTLHRNVFVMVNVVVTYFHINYMHKETVFNQLKFVPFDRSGLCI